MGAIADGIMAYTQPLLDQTDGSVEQLNKALAIGQVCFNLALLPEDERDRGLGELRSSLGMNDRDFDAFRSSVVLPMIRRHEQMFPLMHRRNSPGLGFGGWLTVHPYADEGGTKAARAIPYPGTRPYVPCPCNSGRKYKFCCGRRGR